MHPPPLINPTNANVAQAAELGSSALGNVPAWVAIALTALTMLGGCVAYIHMLMAGVHTRISSTRDWTETKISEVRTELKADIEAEAAERRREYERFEAILEGFRSVGAAVTSVADGVKHLGERFDDNRRSTDRALDEIKHGMRAMDTKIQAISTRREDNAR